MSHYANNAGMSGLYQDLEFFSAVASGGIVVTCLIACGPRITIKVACLVLAACLTFRLLSILHQDEFYPQPISVEVPPPCNCQEPT